MARDSKPVEFPEWATDGAEVRVRESGYGDQFFPGRVVGRTKTQLKVEVLFANGNKEVRNFYQPKWGPDSGRFEEVGSAGTWRSGRKLYRVDDPEVAQIEARGAIKQAGKRAREAAAKFGGGGDRNTSPEAAEKLINELASYIAYVNAITPDADKGE